MIRPQRYKTLCTFSKQNYHSLVSQVMEHQDLCQHCWDGGELVCCAYCPASYHTTCVGLRGVPSKQWSCPHHKGCVECGKKASAIGFSFRCEVCSHAFCEDCLPTVAEIVQGCKRWEEIGFKNPSNCCFIRCSKGCSDYMRYVDEYAENHVKGQANGRGKGNTKAKRRTKRS